MLTESREVLMPFTINAAGAAGAFSFPPAKAKDAFDKILKLEQQGFKNIVVKDERGRIVSRHELAVLCESGQD
jgi:hypothetical protein